VKTVDPEGVLASNELLGVILGAMVVAIGWRNRPFLRDVLGDPEAIWRGLARVAAVVVAGLIGWGSIADNWRQLVGAPYRATQRFASRRVEIDPPSPEVRTITLVLLALTVVLAAALVARHVGGYFLQFALFAGSVALWVPFFVVSQRLNLNLAFGFGGRWTSPLDVSGYVLFVAMAWLVELGFILVSFVILLAVSALPITLLLDLIGRRRPRPTAEANDFFAAFQERARSTAARQ
jgi:hypothetical protein